MSVGREGEEWFSRGEEVLVHYGRISENEGRWLSMPRTTTMAMGHMRAIDHDSRESCLIVQYQGVAGKGDICIRRPDVYSRAKPRLQRQATQISLTNFHTQYHSSPPPGVCTDHSSSVKGE